MATDSDDVKEQASDLMCVGLAGAEGFATGVKLPQKTGEEGRSEESTSLRTGESSGRGTERCPRWAYHARF